MERKWLMLAVSFFSVFSFLFAMQSVPPVIPQIKAEFGVSHTEAGMLISLVALPTIFLSLPAGILTVKLGSRRVGGPGLILATTGALLTYLANSFLTLETGRFVLGIGGAFVTVSAFSAIPRWFSKEELGKAMGIFSINMPIVTVIALNLLPWVASALGWRTGFLIATVVLAAGTLLHFSLMEEKPLKKQAPEVLRGIGNRQIWLLGAVWAFFNMAAISYLTWAGTFFMELKNIPRGTAFFMASFLMIAAMTLTPFTGALSDRLGRRKIFLMVASLGMCVSFLLMPGLSLPALGLPVAMLGLTAAFLPPSLFSLPPEILPLRAGLGYGILNTCLSAGIASGPALVGYIRDILPGEFPVYATMAAFSFLTFVCAGLLKTR
jgi:predicted MFS family arabinose efflux permease